MKLTWLTAIALLFSANAFATCPAGTQESKSFEEAAATAKRMLGQNLRDGGYADERATDGRPVRVQFHNKSGKVAMSVFRSSGENGRYFDRPEVVKRPVQVCSGGGKIIMLGGDITITITDGPGNTMAVNAAKGFMSMNLAFGPIMDGTRVANGDGNGR